MSQYALIRELFRIVSAKGSVTVLGSVCSVTWTITIFTGNK